MSAAHLRIEGLGAGYDGFAVLRDLTLEAKPGLTVILGPNGAGKTTLLKAIAGLIPRQGRIKLDDEDIAPDAPTSAIVQRGLVLVPEGRQLFAQMTVTENLELGGWLVPAAERARRIAQAFVDFPRLAERAKQLAGTMSGGEQQMVAVARALISAPRLLMLDEPSLGLAPKMVAELLAIARRIADAGTTVLMVEQNVRKALAVADRGYVLERGKLIASGPAALLARSSIVRQAYLGKSVGKSAASSPSSSKEPDMSDLSMLINGLAVGAAGGASFERRNPLDGTVATRAPAAGAADAAAACDAAAEAFKTWSQTGPGARRALLLKAADALEAKTPAFVEAMAAETGASGMWAGFNVHLAADMLREAAALTTQISGEVIPSDVPGSLAMGLRQPAGVVLGIAPWNAPVILGVRAIAVPLACGNTVILKGSENCPRTHQLIIEALQDAGFPAGVVNYLTNAPADAGTVVDAIVAHPAVRRVNFTGSTRVGKLIALTCAKHLKPAVLELGGKAPFVVLDDADLDAAVNAAAFGAFANSGQICMSTERIVVDAKVADDFVARLSKKAQSLPLGDPRKGPAVLGSVVGMGTVEHCNALIDDALAKGARLVCGGKAETTLMPATLLDRVTPAMRIYREETFGPVKAIVRVDGVEAAVACANDNEFGLSAAVFGRDIARAYEVAKRIESGICHVNGPTVHDEAQMPFGGVKGSGLGRFGGQAGVHEFTELRWVTVQTTPRHYPF